MSQKDPYKSPVDNMIQLYSECKQLAEKFRDRLTDWQISGMFSAVAKRFALAPEDRIQPDPWLAKE